MITGAKRRIVLATIAIGGMVGASAVFSPLWNVPENVRDARRFLASYHATDRSGMTPKGSPSASEVTNFEIPVAADVETARMIRELPASHGWMVRPSKFNSSTDESRAISYAQTPLERWISAVPIFNRVLRSGGTSVVITLSAHKDVTDFNKERVRWDRGEMWTSAEVETSGADLEREARIMPKHGHSGMFFPPYLRKEYARRGKAVPRP